LHPADLDFDPVARRRSLRLAPDAAPAESLMVISGV
jgi:hypothetical protein